MRAVAWIGHVGQIYSTIVTAGIVIGAVLTVAIGGVILYATGMRYLFGRPQMWTEQLCGIFLVTAGCLALAHCLRKGVHVRVDAIVSRLPPRIQCVAETVVAVTGFGYSCVFVWKGWNLAWISYVRGYTDMFPPGYPLFPSQIMVPIGFSILAVAFLEWGLRAIAKAVRGS